MPSIKPRLVTRVPDDVFVQFKKICDNEKRTISNMLLFVIIKFISEYKTDN